MDVIVIALLVLLALCWFGRQTWRSRRDERNALTYVVLVDGAEVASGVLINSDDAPYAFSVPGRPEVIIRVAEGKAAFHASDCPDQICVRTGYIASRGQSAACLPNGVILLIRGGAADDADDADDTDGVDAVAGLHNAVGMDAVAGRHNAVGMDTVAGLHNAVGMDAVAGLYNAVDSDTVAGLP